MMSTPSSPSTHSSAEAETAAAADMSKPRRVHTDAQLHRKRQVDRLKQKSNRYENKRRMEKLEGDVARLVTAVEDMSRNLRRLSSASASASHSSATTTTTTSSSLMLGLSPPSPVTPLSTEKLELHLPPPRVLTQLALKPSHDRILPAALTGIPGEPSPSRQAAASAAAGGVGGPPNVPVQCRCGVEHANPFDCVEYTSYVVLYQAHLGLAQNPFQAKPKLFLNPPLVNMMLLSTSGDIVVFFATAVLRQFQLADTQTLFGLYLITYRFLRWRLYPDDESLRHVPDWLRPTEIQQACPHPLTLDYIPWPALRDWLCLNRAEGHRHSVAIYTQSLRLRWPMDRPLILPDPKEGVILNPGFTDFAMDIRNWGLVSPWADEFPHLVRYVTVTDDGMA